MPHGYPKRETEVLIVGAGPVGLALAVEFGSRGIDCQVVDQITKVSERWTRAMNFNMRTMEHFRRWGVVDEVRRRACLPSDTKWSSTVAFCSGIKRPEWVCVYTPTSDSTRNMPDAVEDSQWVPQGRTQQVLLDRAQECSSVNVSFGWEAIEVALRPKHIEARCRSSSGDGRELLIKASYVVGCDGARSVVRKAAGIELDGARVSKLQLQADIIAPTLLSTLRSRGLCDAKMYFIGSDELTGILRPLDNDRWDVIFAPQDADVVPDPAKIRKSIEGFLGPDLPFDVEGVQPFYINNRVAESFGHDRAFVAGDAAHIIPFFGGHNLNIGIGDAVNLGWKLAAVLRGWCSPSILETYTVERRKHVLGVREDIIENFNGFKKATELMNQASKADAKGALSESARAELGSQLRQLTHSEFHSDGVALDHRYEGSPIVVDDGSISPLYFPQVYLPSGRPGHRAPVKRDGSWGVHYDLFGDGFVLLAFASGATVDEGKNAIARVSERRGIPLKVLDVSSDEARKVYGADLVLIRPDQHVCWRGNKPPADVDGLLDRICGESIERRIPSPKEHA